MTKNDTQMPIVPRLKSLDLNQIGELLLCAWSLTFWQWNSSGSPHEESLLSARNSHYVLKPWFYWPGSKTHPWLTSRLSVKSSVWAPPTTASDLSHCEKWSTRSWDRWKLKGVEAGFSAWRNFYSLHLLTAIAAMESIFFEPKESGTDSPHNARSFCWCAGPLDLPPPVPTRLLHICHLWNRQKLMEWTIDG